MNVVVLYNEPQLNAPVDELDVIDQRDAVVEALRAENHQVVALPCNLDLETIRRQLIDHQPDVIFNLVESLGGTDRLAPMICMLFEALEIPYTGNQSDSMFATCNKLTVKKRLSEAGLPTPAWRCNERSNARWPTPRPGVFSPAGRNASWILKPVLEHGSFAMDDNSVVTVNRKNRLQELLELREQQVGRPHFAEHYIEGREFNLSLLDGRILPPAEVEFVGFPLDKPRIVGHAAKWDPNSFEYQNTAQRFSYPASDRKLIKELRRLAKRCWELFDLSGYARVDFRVDAEGQPWILEVNPNTCLSPDAGFAAAVAKTGASYSSAIQRIVDIAVTRTLPLRSTINVNSDGF